MSEDKLIDLCRANLKCNNYGSITEIDPEKMPETDLLVYSFPCQDLSTGGLGKGMKKAPARDPDYCGKLNVYYTG